MTFPNTFILGAPKCGTTSMAHWLSQHPAVFMSAIKEPNYFNTDMQPEWGHIREHAVYEDLFKEAVAPQHVITCEATVWYLYSQVAVSNILSVVPNAKFIVMIRNPYEMVQSLHEELVHAGLQKRKNLSKALDFCLSMSTTKADRFLDRKNLNYIECCQLGEQLDRLYQLVPRSQVHVVLADDLKSKPKDVFEKTCAFLELKSNPETRFTNQNKGRKMRSVLLKDLINWSIVQKRKLGFTQSFRIAPFIQKFNKVEQQRSSLDPVLAKKLEEIFTGDILLLEDLLGRSLSHWHMQPNMNGLS